MGGRGEEDGVRKMGWEGGVRKMGWEGGVRKMGWEGGIARGRGERKEWGDSPDTRP